MMKLSEAIRLGAMLSPQGRGNKALIGEHRCALGSALEAIGYKGKIDGAYGYIRETWPFSDGYVLYPVMEIELPIWNIIWKLNDINRWAREQIADWVETVEPRDEEPKVDLDVEVGNGSEQHDYQREMVGVEV